MIDFFSNKGKKPSAWLLLFIFYFQLTAGAFTTILYKYEKAPLRYYSYSFNKEKNAIQTLSLNDLKKASNSNHNSNSFCTWHNNLPVKKVDIGGPGQPEMRAFKSVGTDNMVNDFTGDFSYSIPLLDVGGYPVNLFYNSGIVMEQEAGWVGLGWNLNPGTIARSKRGLPDDFNGNTSEHDRDKIIKYQHIKPDVTVGADIGTNLEIAGMPKSISVGLKAGVFWNNRRGLGLLAGGDFSFKKAIAGGTCDDKTYRDLKMSIGATLNSQNGFGMNAGIEVTNHECRNAVSKGLGTSIDYNSRTGLGELKIEVTTSKDNSIDCYMVPIKGSEYQSTASLSFARPSYTPSIRMPMTRKNGYLQVKLGGEATIFHGNGTVSGSLSTAYIAADDQIQIKPAFGLMYYQEANGNNDALLDFNRMNDGVYNLKTPLISVPEYTYDIFTINGEGTGGSFRGYRGNIGFVRDNFTKSKNESFNLALDAGAGNVFHGGIDGVGGVYSTTEAGNWNYGNGLQYHTAFKESNGTYEGFYFKNPAEKTIMDASYYAAVGDDKLIRPKLEQLNLSLPLAASKYEVFGNDKNYSNDINVTETSAKRNQRDKRTQIISYLTAEEASRIGLQKQIISYQENVFKSNSCDHFSVIKRYDEGNNQYIRKAHHLSEIDVLEADGKRYVFGLPAYNVTQRDVSFSIEPGQGDYNSQMTSIEDRQNSLSNDAGRDHFFESEIVSGFAHSFLLTGILSPDYVDVTGDGITDDDHGTSIKFNYTRVNKKAGTVNNEWENQFWRTPYLEKNAHFNPGLRSDNADDKGLYTYGEKELWYTHSIETKNMIATFTLERRKDARPVKNELGGISQDALGQRRLKRIDLYTKSEFLKANPVPVKTVHFAYSYRLCPNTPDNNQAQELVDNVDVNANHGKLTLESVWFTYNGNERQIKNKYKFKYAENKTISLENGSTEVVNCNPAYDATQVDRWGLYKPNAKNPSAMINMDFPYTLQSGDNVARNNAYASAWNLEKVLLPSGSVISVAYEADDYAFVQNRKAAQMTKIAGFGESASEISDKLYDFDITRLGNPGGMDRNFVFFDVDDPITSVTDIKERYLAGLKQLLMKIWVQMPKDFYGEKTFEPINVYATIKDFGYDPSYNKRFWVELNKSSSNGSKIMETVFQFVKDKLPSKVYKGYDAGNQPAIRQIVNAIQGLASSFYQAIEGFEYNVKSKKICQLVNLDKSFARLGNPVGKKQGGGHRVKRVVISDNWKKMIDPQNTNPAQLDSYYGQEYEYTTVEGNRTISSGVTTYEPGIGAEENPFREVLSYSESQPLGPTSHFNVELPVTETFFPSPVVGYSKIVMKSIHNKSNKNIKSGIGKTVKEFYTCREFPVITDYTSFDGRSFKYHKPKALTKILFNYSEDMLTLAQGFRVVLNDMNGKLKSTSSYSETDELNPINQTSYKYKTVQTSANTYRPSNTVPAILGPSGIIEDRMIGKDVEVMNDFREHAAYTSSVRIPGNVEGFFAGPLPLVILNILHMTSSDISIFHSAATLKVIHEYGIIESVTNIDKGSYVTTSNLAYDAETGEALVSSVTNEFNKPMYSLNYPAHWVNSGMSLAYQNIGLTYKNVQFKNGRLYDAAHVDLTKIESGDEIYVVPDNSDAVPIGQCVSAGFSQPVLPVTAEFKIWAIDVNKDPNNPDPSFVFLDRYGIPYNGNAMYMRVVRSGKRNMASVSVGSVTSLANPIVQSGGTSKIEINNNTKVIASSAVEFKERWKVEDATFKKMITANYDHYVPLHKVNFKFNHVHSLSMTNYGCSDCDNYFYLENDVYNNMPVRKFNKRVKRFLSGTFNQPWEHQSFVELDLDQLQNDWIITSAKLRLGAHTNIANGSEHLLTYTNPHFGSSNINTRSHNGAAPHFSSPTPQLNGFIVSKLKERWPNDNNGWSLQPEFYHMPSDPMQTVFVPAPSSNVQSYFLNENTGIDTRIEIASIIRKMQAEKNIFGSNYRSGIKLSMAVPYSQAIDKEIRVCFDGSEIPPPPTGTNKNTLLSVPAPPTQPFEPNVSVTYYKCSEALPYGSPAPTVPYAICTVYETNPICKSRFEEPRINYYALGLLGNWRPWRNYVYYGDRVEKDPAQATDIANNGVIENFEPFWVNTPGFLEKSNSTKWKWNSETTLLNRKGTEIENHDPLGRYNAGIYGYLETMPVAVANNARAREIAFDGFEDYGYNDQQCPTFCSPFKRHFEMGDLANYLSTEAQHSGKSSIKINGSEPFSFQSAVIPNNEQYEPVLQLNLLNNSFSNASATLEGTGLTPKYYSTNNFTGNFIQTAPELPSFIIKSLATVPPTCSPDMNVLPTGCTNVSAEWNGSIVTAFSGDYQFAVTGNGMYADDWAEVSINNAVIASSEFQTSSSVNNTFHMEAGQAYAIRIKYKQTYGMGQLQFKWKIANSTSPYLPVPIENLYPVGSTIPPAITQLGSCAAPGDIKATNAFIDRFSLIPGERYVMSAWVREGVADCHCKEYNNNSIEIKADGVSITGLKKAKGAIIEGWQRYEFDFTVPNGTQNLEFLLRSSAGVASYFDDIRIHPFKSNLKSYVYHPETLRLGAELDENNYATFYEYDDEGTLVRVKKETREGIKTITETRSAIQKSIQDF